MQDEQENPGVAELEKLAAELDNGDFEARLIPALRSRWPCLRVRNRRAGQLTEDIYAGAGAFWWSWAQRLAPLTDVAAAAATIARVLASKPDQP